MKNKKLVSISEVCPNCVEPLVLQKKKLGSMVNWFICPTCGFRERPAAGGIISAITGNFIGSIRAANIRVANL